jgi:hypothetical protein
LIDIKIISVVFYLQIAFGFQSLNAVNSELEFFATAFVFRKQFSNPFRYARLQSIFLAVSKSILSAVLSTAFSIDILGCRIEDLVD